MPLVPVAGKVKGSWFLLVGLDSTRSFEWFSQALVSPHQPSLFYALIFLHQCLFHAFPVMIEKVSISLCRARQTKRIWIPAMTVLLFIVPACIAFKFYVAGAEDISYIPDPGPAWFLFWLLLMLNWVYTSIRQAELVLGSSSVGPTIIEGTIQQPGERPQIASTPEQREVSIPFPSTCTRIGFGGGVCGMLQLVVFVISPGSLVCYHAPMDWSFDM